MQFCYRKQETNEIEKKTREILNTDSRRVTYDLQAKFIGCVM